MRATHDLEDIVVNFVHISKDVVVIFVDQIDVKNEHDSKMRHE